MLTKVSVNSPENPWSQSGKRKGRLWSEGFVEKGFKTGMKEWKDEGWWNWWVDGTDRRSATRRTGWVRTGEISAWLTEGSRELIPETRGNILKINPHKRRHSRWKLSQKLKGKEATFFAQYTCVEMASRKVQTYQNKAKNLCTIYFVFDLDGECKFIKTKHYSD